MTTGIVASAMPQAAILAGALGSVLSRTSPLSGLVSCRSYRTVESCSRFRSLSVGSRLKSSLATGVSAMGVRCSPSAQSHADVVSFPVVAQRHIAVRQWLPVQLDRFDAATHASRVVHQNSVCRGPVAIAQFKPGPSPRDTWLETKGAAPQSETQDRFNGDAIEPARRA